MDNVTPITAAEKPEKEHIEEQRTQIFRAMNLVQTTVLSLRNDLDRRGTLEAAYEVLERVAAEL